MVKKKKSEREVNGSTHPGKIRKMIDALHNETFLFVIGIVLILLSIYLFISISSFLFNGAADQSIIKGDAESVEVVDNNGGSLGATVSDFLVNDSFGLSIYFMLFFIFVLGLKFIRVTHRNLSKWFISCCFGLIWGSLFSASALTKLFATFSHINPGGMHGLNMCRWLTENIGTTGLVLLLLLTAILFAVYVNRNTILYIRKLFCIKLPPVKTAKKEDPDDVAADDVDENEDETRSWDEKEDEKVVEDVDVADTAADFVVNVPTDDENEVQPEDIYPYHDEQQADADTDVTDKIPETDKQPEEPDFIIEGYQTDGEDELVENREPYNPKLDLEYYKYPMLDLLNSYDDNTPAVDMEEQKANKDRIINVLRSFGIEISTIKATVGPTITLYEITPAPGVRISKIRNLEDDIALSLSALGIRIIAPIPGKGTIGIEVPNSKKLTVSMQSVLGNKKYQETTFDLPIALGKTITNEVFMVDLCKMPHLLVAGATGMGKSVGLNALITSLLYKKHPAELKFVMIDPKKVEFSIYEPIERHFLAKLADGDDAIITDVTQVIKTLKSLCIEMDSRYDLLKKAHVRTLKEYNEKFINRQLNPNKGHKYLPYIVVVIDEFGDLIMTAGKEIELPIARIAQLARAVGIHMVIATQRPTTNIITGTIKANFPARMAFRVAAMMDSRTILDRPGANQLIGRGDMLFLTGSDPVRVQCAFVDTPEIEKVCDYVSRQQAYPNAYYLPEVPDENEDRDGAADVDTDRLDSMFEDAARLVVIHQQGSTSLIQRKFSIGYNRAGRIMDQLEATGIVGPAEGSKPRQVFCTDENDLEFRLNSILKRNNV